MTDSGFKLLNNSSAIRSYSNVKPKHSDLCRTPSSFQLERSQIEIV
ncbi:MULTISPECIES: hypothetical protein [Moorena]|nr:MULTISPECIES: hypothetical protein [Moorena]NEP30229.1 hypothetical protein [Moorena sp. SIO3B2]NEQ04955.1 hypothetical protein [Moorena sp. SIO4E2]NER87551.1 hypothetical protein [Moorena sp. SIO3A2]NES39941.1 hypothetical protein [Moorena sp. SIO2C4]